MAAPKVTFWRAEYTSKSFEFEAYGASEADAVTALKVALRRHGEQYGCKRDWYYRDDLFAYPVRIGGGYRDKEEI
jgi:hypothetical protein